MNRLFLLMVMLCVVVSGHSKRKIDLRDQARHPGPPIEVYIDDRILEFDILNESGVFNVIIKDVSGNIVFTSFVDCKVGITPIELAVEKGEYVIYIDYMGYKSKGNFFVE